MGELFYIILSGMAIGLLISAPMGPIGVLCIQRTLNRGRWAGFYTGAGAALSDLIYCLLTGLGLSSITDLVETNKNILQVIGGAVLLVYAVYLIKYRKEPEQPGASYKRHVIGDSVTTSKAITKRNQKVQDFVTGFFLTVSNPLILFLTIGLFARFNFILPEYQFYHYVTGYVAIVGGAIGWWLLITWFVNSVRNKFSSQTMRRINVMIGVIILIMSLVGIYSGIVDYLTLPQINSIL